MSAVRSSRQAPSHQSLFQSTCSSIAGLNLKEMSRARKSRQEDGIAHMRNSVEALLSMPPQPRPCESTRNMQSHQPTLFSSSHQYIPPITVPSAEYLESDPLILQRKVRNLEEKLDEAYRQQHSLENMIEEYEVTMKRQEEQLKAVNKKCNDLQKKFWTCSQQNKEMEEQLRRAEGEKAKLSEKWVRLSAKNKCEDKAKVKMKSLEMQNDLSSKEAALLADRIQMLEKENERLKRKCDSYAEEGHRSKHQIQIMAEQVQDYREQKHLADKVTKELLSRIQIYEQKIMQDMHEGPELLQENQNTMNRARSGGGHRSAYVEYCKK